MAVVVVEVGMNQFDRIAGRVADDRPRETKPVADTVDQLPIRCAQLDAFAVVVEFADPRAKRLAAELGLELIRLMSDDGEAPGRNGAADGEGKLHGVLQRPAAEVDRLFPGVVQLDKFDLLNFDIWVEMYFIDNHSPRSQFSNTQ